MRLFDSTVLIFIVACVAATYASGVLWLNSPIFNVQMLCVATGAWLILMLGRLRSINTHSQGIQRRILVALGVCVVLVAPLHDMFSDDTRR
jgi:peptidoglycan/LPS O-acetylase OafA/YrhL